MFRWRQWRTAAATAVALLALRVRVPLDSQLSARFPGAAPRSLAHFLADFTNYPRLYPHIGVWRLERETSNYTTWHYEVRYECGARCDGRIELSAHDALGSPVHRLLLRDERCDRLTPLPLSLCSELEVHSEVDADEAQGGAMLQERSRSWCGLLHLLAGEACVPAVARIRHLRLLQRAFTTSQS